MGAKMSRLPQVIGHMSREKDVPKVVGLDNKSSFLPGYSPEKGITDSFLLLLENSSYMLIEDESFILVY